MSDSELLASFRPNPAPVGDEARAAARARLLDAIAQPPPRRRPRRRALVLGAALAAATLLLIAQPWQATSHDAQARAAAAIALRPGTVLHFRAQGHRIYTPWSETWQVPGGAWREQHGGASKKHPSCTVEDGFDPATRTVSNWDVSTRTIYVRAVRAADVHVYEQPNPVSRVRTWLAQRQLRRAGNTRIDGRDVVRLVPTKGHTLRGATTYYVDATTYAPVRWQLNATQWYDFTIYERLRATPANIALTSIRAQHPSAPIRRGWGSPTGCASG